MDTVSNQFSVFARGAHLCAPPHSIGSFRLLFHHSGQIRAVASRHVLISPGSTALARHKSIAVSNRMFLFISECAKYATIAVFITGCLYLLSLCAKCATILSRFMSLSRCCCSRHLRKPFPENPFFLRLVCKSCRRGQSRSRPSPSRSAPVRHHSVSAGS